MRVSLSGKFVLWRSGESRKTCSHDLQGVLVCFLYGQILARINPFVIEIATRSHSSRKGAEVRHMGGCSVICAQCFAAVLQVATGHPRLPRTCRVAKWHGRVPRVSRDTHFRGLLELSHRGRRVVRTTMFYFLTPKTKFMNTTGARLILLATHNAVSRNRSSIDHVNDKTSVCTSLNDSL